MCGHGCSLDCLPELRPFAVVRVAAAGGTGVTNAGSPSSWRDPILVHFTKEIATVARLTIVSDPDRLLTERRSLTAFVRVVST